MRKTLVEIEEDMQYINIASRKSPFEHAMIRVILSSLAEKDELLNLRKRDVVVLNEGGEQIHYLYLRKGGKVRKAPIDVRTHKILTSITRGISGREEIFRISEEELNQVVMKYSPKNKKYNAESLRRAVIMILEDNLLGKSYKSILSSNIRELYDFMSEFHPMFSGMWDLEDDDVAFDYFSMLSKRYGIKDFAEMSEISGENEERIERLMNRKWFQNYMDF